MKGLAIIGWLLTALGLASDSVPQGVLVADTACPIFAAPPRPRVHYNIMPRDPAGDNREIA